MVINSLDDAEVLNYQHQASGAGKEQRAQMLLLQATFTEQIRDR